MIKSMTMSYTSYLGITKQIELTVDQIQELQKQFTFKEIAKRFIASCKSYTHNYWVTGYINNHKICWFQCNQF